MRQAFTHVVSASAGAVVSAFVRVPTDTLKHRVQAYVLPDVFRASPRCPPALYSGLAVWNGLNHVIVAALPPSMP